MEEVFMRRAIELAKKGEGNTNPNPLVGAVIVKDGRIIGEGYHARYGGPHAERNAILSLQESAEGAELYVTLEPCCHTGKTPPCTEAILEQKIRRVIIGSRDPNPKVSGKGAAILRAAGVQVVEDFLKEECDRLNPVFFHYITTGTPYVVMKYAMTADGKTASKTGQSKWITSEASREYVQSLRRRYMGILTGIGTVFADDPMLNVRSGGQEEAENLSQSPVRILCDSRLRLPLDSRICLSARKYRTIVVCAVKEEKKQKALEELGVEVLYLPDSHGQVDLAGLMHQLGEQGIDSILLEGGGILNESALRAGIVQEIKAFVAPKIFGGCQAKTPADGEGVSLPDEAVQLTLQNTRAFGEDILLEYRVCRFSKGERGEGKKGEEGCLPE